MWDARGWRARGEAVTPDAMVLLDQMEEQGYPGGTRWVVALGTAADADADVADDADDDAAAADADDADAADADDDAAAAASAAADVVAQTPNAIAVRKRIHNLLTEEQPMREGLLMVTLPGRYGYSVTLVGWVRHVRGFEYELLPGHLSIVRTAGRRTLGELAAEGPGDDHRLTVAKTAEDLHELRVRRVLACDEKSWKAHCPRPTNWEPGVKR